MQLEEEFGVNLSEAAAEEIQTIEDAIRALRRQRNREQTKRG
jgi:acyl carrier protein